MAQFNPGFFAALQNDKAGERSLAGPSAVLRLTERRF
jgi:hypothetical protein